MAKIYRLKNFCNTRRNCSGSHGICSAMFWTSHIAYYSNRVVACADRSVHFVQFEVGFNIIQPPLFWPAWYSVFTSFSRPIFGYIGDYFHSKNGMYFQKWYVLPKMVIQPTILDLEHCVILPSLLDSTAYPLDCLGEPLLKLFKIFNITKFVTQIWTSWQSPAQFSPILTT